MPEGLAAPCPQGRWLTAPTRHRPGAPGGLRWSSRVSEQFSTTKVSAACGSSLSAKRQRGADGAAMGDGDDVAAAVLGGEALDWRPHAVDEIDEALPARRALVRGGEPECVRADPSLRVEGFALEPLPFAQMLLGELRHLDRLDCAVAAAEGCHDRRCGLARAGEVARVPHRVGGQLACQRVEDFRCRAIAIEIALAIDAPAIGHGSVANPPPPGLVARHPRYSIVTTILPMALRAPRRAMASPALASG